MTNKYDMVVLDLDGTLLNSNKTISSDDINTIKKLKNDGVIIVIATGRSFYEAYNLTSSLLGTDITIVANNGAIIRHTKNFSVIDKNALNDEAFKTIYELGKSYNLYPLIHVDEYNNNNDIIIGKRDCGDSYNKYINMDMRRYRYADFDMECINNILSICYFGTKECLYDFEKIVKSKYRNEINTICVDRISEKSLLEIQHIGACKYISVKKLAQNLNISKDRIVAIGDDNNDINLLKNVGVGIAMKNGSEVCKKSAKYISRFDNDNSGVSYELMSLFY